jgi:hypothetical protein
MEKSRPAVVTIMAILHFILAFLLPPELLLSVSPVLLLPLALFVFLGWATLTLKRRALAES